MTESSTSVTSCTASSTPISVVQSTATVETAGLNLKLYAKGHFRKPQISNFGRVKTTTNIIHSGGETAHGYRAISAYGVNTPAHVMVAIHFLGPQPTPDHVIDHIDGNRSNNDVANLRWVTVAQNNSTKREYTRMQCRSTGVEMRKKGETEWVFYKSYEEASRQTGLPPHWINHASKSILNHVEINFDVRVYRPVTFEGEEFRKYEDTHTEISNFGRVRIKCGAIHAGTLNASGYMMVGIKGMNLQMHRCVAKLFPDLIGRQPSEKHNIDHIDGNKKNNNWQNLQWVTQSEQVRRSWHSGRPRKKRSSMKPVWARSLGTDKWTHRFDGVREAGKFFNISCNNISYVCDGRHKHAGGYEFKREEPEQAMVLEGEIWKDIDTNLLIAYRARHNTKS